MRFDAVVLGLGGMGSAAAAHLAGRGRTVLGVEQFGRAHDRGSSTGQSRIIRMAYFEDPAYVPLLRRAYALWTELEASTGMTLIDWCGILMAGAADSAVLAGAARSAELHAIPIEELTRAGAVARYPALRMRDGEYALFEPRAGMIFPEPAIEAHLRVAEAAGAELRFATGVRGYRTEHGAIRVEFADGTSVETQRLAICAGPWLSGVTAELALPLVVQRNVQIWFTPSIAAYARARFPAFFVDRADAPAALYGFPDCGDGVKAALHGFGQTAVPAHLDRNVRAADIAAVKTALDEWMPGAAAAYRSGKVCMYTRTPDEHFIIDTHPRDARIVVAGGFSGHGFKFCPVVGEIVADLLLDGRTRHPIDFLRIDRFGTAARA
jgi:sarcosine oxidase